MTEGRKKIMDKDEIQIKEENGNEEEEEKKKEK